LVDPLQLGELLLRKRFLLVYFEEVVGEVGLLPSQSNLGGNDGVAFNDGSHLHLAGKFFNLGRLACNILLVDVPFQFEQDQLVADVICALVGDEL
jgi:hypothetical protein